MRFVHRPDRLCLALNFSLQRDNYGAGISTHIYSVGTRAEQEFLGANLLSLCIGLSGLGARERTARDNSWLKRRRRLTVSIILCCLICMYCEFSSLRWSRALRSKSMCSILTSLGSPPSCIGGMASAGVPGWVDGGFWWLYSRCTRAWRDALRLISRKPTRSPRLKFPFPCLNSHMAVSGPPW